MDSFRDKGLGFIDCLIKGFTLGKFSSNHCSKGTSSTMCMTGLNSWTFPDKLVILGKEEILGTAFEMTTFDDHRLRTKILLKIRRPARCMSSGSWIEKPTISSASGRFGVIIVARGSKVCFEIVSSI